MSKSKIHVEVAGLASILNRRLVDPKVDVLSCGADLPKLDDYRSCHGPEEGLQSEEPYIVIRN